MSTNVIVMGKGTLAIRVADWFIHSPRHKLDQIVPAIPEPPWTNSFSTWADQEGVPRVRSGRYEDIPGCDTEGWTVDLVVSVFYSRIIREWFIDRCTRIINIHNGLLPRYRGVSPINWGLKNGESKHGVTVHEITSGIDKGPIVAQIEYSLYPEFDEVIDVYRRALAYGWTLFEQTIPLLEKITPRPQDSSSATYHSHSQDYLLGERRGFTKRETLEEVPPAQGQIRA